MTARNSADKRANLAALRILLPRPRRNRDDFVVALQSLGCQPYLLPVIDIVALPMSGDEGAAFLASLAAADHVIFASGNAATLALTAMNAAHMQFPETTKIYAIGEATASVLAAGGVKVLAPSAGADSEGLLAKPELAEVAGQSVLICRGEGGRDKLKSVLSDRGAQVSYRDLYRRQPSHRYSDDINALLDTGRVDVVVIHSGEILAALWRQLTADSRKIFAGLPVLVPGKRVASLAQDLGCDNIIVAESALPRSLVAALVHWYTQQQQGLEPVNRL
jgi:uroporphyrinogen-III synthase